MSCCPREREIKILLNTARIKDEVENGWILISASAFSLLHYPGLVEKCEDHLALYIIGKARCILKVFSNNCGCSFSILHQSSINHNFLKVKCNVESDIMSINFPSNLILKSIGISCALHAFVTSRICRVEMLHCVNADLPMFIHFTLACPSYKENHHLLFLLKDRVQHCDTAPSFLPAVKVHFLSAALSGYQARFDPYFL